MNRARAGRAAFIPQAEAYLTLYFGIPDTEGYIRAHIARDLAYHPELCAPTPALTKPLRQMRWYDLATAVVTSGWIGWYSQRTEVDEALRRQVDPNATRPIDTVKV